MQAAIAVFQEMLQRKQVPDVTSNNALISACEKGEQWQAAIAVFHEMLQRKQAPRVISYSALISACEKISQPVWLLVFFRGNEAAV